MVGDGESPRGHIPLEYYRGFLEFLHRNSDQVNVITYADLPWGGDRLYRFNYPLEWLLWKRSLVAGKRDPSKIYVILQHDVDSLPERTSVVTKMEMERGIPSNLMVFRNLVDRVQFNQTGDVKLLDYDVDWDLLERLEKGHGFVIGYHSNVYEQSAFDSKRAMNIFCEDVAALRKRFDVRHFSPHGGPRDAQGRSNNHLSVPRSLRRSIRWVANSHTVRLDGAYSDGGLDSKHRDPNARDLRDFVATWRPGRRYRVLTHPQYYHTPVRDDTRISTASWHREVMQDVERGLDPWHDVFLQASGGSS